MQDHESRNFSTSNFDALFDWEPDIRRFGREVREAELAGKRDELSLVEMECSIDLLEAELASARREPKQARRLQGLITNLAALIERMNRVPS